MGDDRGLLAKYRIAAGMIAVPVGVQNESERPVAQAAQRGLYLVGQGRELIINNQQPI